MKNQKNWPALAVLFLFAARLSAQTQVSIPYFSILSPAYLASLYQQGDGNYSTASFGGNIVSGDVTGQVKVPDVDSFFCNPDGTDFVGKIALIRRGICPFQQKVLNAEAAGAIGVIIVNAGNTVVTMGGDTSLPEPAIPVIMVTKQIDDAIKQALAQGESVTVAFTNSPPLNFGIIEGTVRRDDNDNCIAEAGEVTLKDWFMLSQNASGATAIRKTDATGRYKFFADTSGSPYTVSVLPPNQAWAPCPASTTVTLTGPDTVQADFAVQIAVECVELEAEISAPLLRRCFSNYFSVNICNNGTVAATGAYADVMMAPEFDPIMDATLPFTTLSPDVYRFQLDTLEPGECLSFSFQAVVNCDSTMNGQTLCYEVHAYPDTSCTQNSPVWSGASVSVIGKCEGDSVRFMIKNTGSGNMSAPQQYAVIENAALLQSGQFQLNAGESQLHSFPANGSTWRLEAAQEPNHPVPGTPSATVEACTQGSNFTTGFYLMFPQYDPGSPIDEECQEVVGSYDPNDKQGFPHGFGDQHLIRPNTGLEYLIRFQNTGTDTAFTVVVRDTLPAALDAASIRLGPASHAYDFEKTEQNVLVFRFENILLVDSFTNEPASHGFLSFKIQQQPDNAFGTLIQNSAAIYFDFNPPVITNETLHEVGEVVGISLSLPKEPGKNAANIPVVFPNPAASASVLTLRGEGIENAPWRLFDTSGRQLASGRLDGLRLRLPQSGLPAGMLWLEVRAKTGEAYFVKVVIR